MFDDFDTQIQADEFLDNEFVDFFPDIEDEFVDFFPEDEIDYFDYQGNGDYFEND